MNIQTHRPTSLLTKEDYEISFYSLEGGGGVTITCRTWKVCALSNNIMINLFGEGVGCRCAGNSAYYLIGLEMNWKIRQLCKPFVHIYNIKPCSEPVQPYSARTAV